MDVITLVARLVAVAALVSIRDTRAHKRVPANSNEIESSTTHHVSTLTQKHGRAPYRRRRHGR